MNCLAKFEKFLCHSIIAPSFMTVGGQMPELDRGSPLPLPYILGSQNTLYMLGLIAPSSALSFMLMISVIILNIKNKNT